MSSDRAPPSRQLGRRRHTGLLRGGGTGRRRGHARHDLTRGPHRGPASAGRSDGRGRAAGRLLPGPHGARPLRCGLARRRHAGGSTGAGPGHVLRAGPRGRVPCDHRYRRGGPHPRPGGLRAGPPGRRHQGARRACHGPGEYAEAHPTWVAFRDATRRGDVDAMLGLLAPAAVWHDLRPIVGEAWKGDDLRPAVEAFVRSGSARIERAPIATRGEGLELGTAPSTAPRPRWRPST